MNTMNRVTDAVVACAALCVPIMSAAFPSPQLSQVSTSIVQGKHAKVTVNYHLSEPAIVLCDVVTNSTEGLDVTIGPEYQLTFAGDIGRKVEAGDRSFTWNATADWPSNQVTGVKVKLTAYPTNRPPPYLVVDLAPDAAERYRYYASADAIPGYPESDLYRTQKLVMRFIRAKNIPWTMGAMAEGNNKKMEYPHDVRLRSNYWMAVFEMTVGQHAWFADGGSTSKTNHYPLCRFGTYDMIRGAENLYPAEPSGTSHLGKLYARTGIRFELPSDAQWMYAARAGHGEHLWGDGTEMTTLNLTNGIGQAVCSLDGGRLERAGSRRPNDFGLYDTMGNVREACLDWYQVDISWNTNGIANANGAYLADGVTAGVGRICHGGYYVSGFEVLRPAYREDTQKGNTWVDGFGYRVMSTFGLE